MPSCEKIQYVVACVQTIKTGIPGTDTPTNKERLLTAYAAYNRQNSEALLAPVSEDVDWPDGRATDCTAKPICERTGRANGR